MWRNSDTAATVVQGVPAGIPIPVTAGLGLPLFDYLSNAPTDTTDVYTLKRGGAGGTTVATVTVVYTDDTRSILSTVTRAPALV